MTTLAGEKKAPAERVTQPGQGGRDGINVHVNYPIKTSPIQVANCDATRAALDPAALALDAIQDVERVNGKLHGAAPRFEPKHADQVADLPPIKWIVKGEIPANGLTLLYGATGSGKSFLALDNYALAVAETHVVIYVAAEGLAGYAPRLLAWMKHTGKATGQLFFVEQAADLLSDDDTDALISAITPLSPALVIVDTLARCMHGGDENTSRDMGLAVESADRIKRAMGGAVILVHHATKSGTTERGSGALKAACDQVIRLDNDDGLLTVSCEKSKDGAPFDPRYLRLLPIETGRKTEDGDPETSCIAVAADKVMMRGQVTATGRKLLETLAMETFKDSGGRASVLIEVTGMKPASFYRVASALVRDGYARQSEKGDPYYLTQKGETTLTTIKSLS